MPPVRALVSRIGKLTLSPENHVPRYSLNKRVDVPVVEPEPEPVPVTGPEAPPVPGSGNPTNPPGSRPPAIGSPEAGQPPAENPGAPGSKPPPIGSPQSSNPGSDPGLSQADVTYQKMITASEKPINEQNEAIANKAGDADTMDWSDKYRAATDKTGALEDLAYRPSIFEYLKLDESSIFRNIRLVSNKETTPPADPNKPVHDALYGKDSNAIIAKQSWRVSDGYSDADRLKWYQITFKNWKDQAGSDAGKLKWVVRDTISNDDTRTVIKKALSKVGIDPDKPFTTKQVGVFGPSDDSFKALAGTDNGRGVFYMLGRYHKELGDLKVVSIHAWVDDGIPFMALELGH